MSVSRGGLGVGWCGWCWEWGGGFIEERDREGVEMVWGGGEGGWWERSVDGERHPTQIVYYARARICRNRYHFVHE